ncbi:MAG TPA: Mur ligase family protein [Casimicrobiaceae bacterium]|jgi:UDP-N-acetylmuramyl pentapeptide synthase|nr:Mur ligase family protein [Casimicrobiaceae bacterium]
MRFRIRDLPAMLATPAGRMHVRQGIAYRSWPLLSRLARLYRRSLVRKTRVIAVTGSFGKSTTTRAIAAALGVPEHGSMLSNAWSWIVLALLRIRPGQRHAVIEVGISKPGQMKAYARTVGPDIAVVTAIGSEHHRSLGTLEVTRAEKSWMLQVLPASGTGVLNGDDPNVMWMKQKTRARVVTFGFGADCDVRAGEIRLDWPRGMHFHLTAFGEERDVAVRLLGRHMVYPILAAIAVSQLEGYALDPTLARLRELAPTTGRMDPVLMRNGVTVLRDDFKSTLETVHTALDVLAQVPASRRVVLLGSVSEPPGPQRPIYQALGERVAGMASHLIVFNNEFEPYWSGAHRGGMPRSAVTNAGRSARDAAEALSQLLQPGDVLLIKGRGPEKLDRVRLILEGRRVGCDIRYCSLRTQECEQCPMLERGWEGHRVIM